MEYLTLEYAQTRIADTQNLLELSAESGLSSPGRLYDLFVTQEALTPEEYQSKRAGIQIQYGIHHTPFGHAFIALTPRGVCHLSFLETSSDTVALQHLRADWPHAKIIADQKTTQEICDRIFDPVSSSPLKLHVQGTNFQLQVWQVLLRLPFGGLATYQGLAQSLGKPTAARAIGTAVGKNPVGYLIPCHRVIRSSGALGGYRWGLERKAAILEWEAAQAKMFPPPKSLVQL